MKIIFVTGNKDKFGEAKQIIPELEQQDIDLTEIQGIDSKEIITHKLEEAKKVLQGNLVVEDNSLSFDCLGGLPGSLIKWFLKTIGNEGLVKITESFGNNKAKAAVVIGFSNTEGTTDFFEGSIEGEIVKPRGKNGFGWDPIFLPNGWSKTFGEMTFEEKNEISMRKIAFKKLKEYILRVSGE